jgi:hypothetical protein
MTKPTWAILVTLCAGCGAGEPLLVENSEASSAGAGSVTGAGCVNPANLALDGGTSMQGPTAAIVPVDWGSGISANANNAAKNLYATLQQSDTPFISWLQSEYQIPSVELGQHVVITPSNTSTTLTFKNIQDELVSQIKNKVLVPSDHMLYMIHFPSTITTQDINGRSSCTGTLGFCGYHYFVNQAVPGVASSTLYYAVIPDFESTACATKCFETKDFGPLDAQQAFETHEIIEAFTDPDVKTGWMDRKQPPGFCAFAEIGDLCDGTFAQIDGAGGITTLQKMWSNAASDCVTGDQTPTISQISPNSGPTSGGTVVTITGARFAPSTVFHFSSATATGTCPTATTCTVTTPVFDEHTSLRYPVHVTATANGNVSSWDGSVDSFAYNCTVKACDNVACGTTVSNNCGGTQFCGCATGAFCISGTCCKPATAAVACQGRTCGTVSDGCGGTITCGPTCPCLTQAQACGTTLSCGTVSNGCGGTVSCGTCAAGFSCSGGQCVKVRACPAGLVNCGGECVKPNFCQ